MFKKISLKNKLLEDVLTVPSIKLINDHVFKIGLAHLVALKKTYKTSPEQVSVLGEALIEKINSPILEDFKSHPLKNFFYLAFVNLPALWDVPVRDPNTRLSVEEFNQFNTLINKKLYFCMDFKESSFQQNHMPKQVLVVSKMIKYMGFQTQVMNLLKPFFKPTDPFITALFSAPLSILNQKKLLLDDNGPLVCSALMSFTHQLKSTNQNSEFINSDWFLKFIEHHFDCSDIYEKEVREYIFPDNLPGLGEAIENEIIPKAIKAYKQHPYGHDIFIDYKDTPIKIPRENIPKFEYIKKVNLYSAINRYDKLLELFDKPICGISYQNIIAALLNPENPFIKLPELYKKLTHHTHNWLKNSYTTHREKLHALEQLTVFLIYNKLGNQPLSQDCYHTKNHFATLPKPILDTISKGSTNADIRNLIDMILEQYEKIEEITSTPTKDRQQFYSLILAFSICNKDKGLFYFCANKMLDAVKTDIDITDINLIILKRLFDYYDEDDINYFRNFISNLVVKANIAFKNFEQSKPTPEFIYKNNYQINRLIEGKKTLKLAIDYLEKTLLETLSTTKESELDPESKPETLRFNDKSISIHSDRAQTSDLASTEVESETESSQSSRLKPSNRSTSTKNKKKILKRIAPFNQVQSQLPMELDLDTASVDTSNRFIEDRILKFSRCNSKPLLLAKANNLTEDEKWEYLYTQLNISHSYFPIDASKIIQQHKYEILLNLKLIIEKLNSSSHPFHSYKEHTIYELKHASTYRLFVSKDSNDKITLIHNCEYSEIAHNTQIYKKEICTILDTKTPISLNPTLNSKK